MAIFLFNRKSCLLGVFCVLSLHFGYAQGNDSAIGRKYFDSLNMNLYNKTIKGYLPFDVPFVLSGDVPDNVIKIELIYIAKQDISIYLTHNKTGFDKNSLEYKNGVSTAFSRFLKSFKRKKKRSNQISKTLNLGVDYNKQQNETDTNHKNEKRINADTLNLNFYKYYELVPDDFWYYSKWDRSPAILKAKNASNSSQNIDKFYIYMEALKPNREYLFFVRLTYSIQNDSTEKSEIISLLKTQTTPVIVNNLLNEAKIQTEKKYDFSFFKFDSIQENYKLFYTSDSKNPKDSISKLFSKNYEQIAQYLSLSLKLRLGLTVEEDKIKKAISQSIKEEEIQQIITLNNDWLTAVEGVKKRALSAQLENTTNLESALQKGKFSEDYNRLIKLKFLQTNFSAKEAVLTGRSDFNIQTAYLEDLIKVNNSQKLNTNISNIDKLIAEIEQFTSLSMNKWNESNSLEVLDNVNFQKSKKEIEDLQEQLAKLKKEAKPDELEIRNKEKDIEVAKKRMSELGRAKLNEIQGLYEPLIKFVNILKYGIKYDLFNIQTKLDEIDKFWLVETNKIAIYFETSSNIAANFQSTSTNTFMTRAEYYISGDFGIAGMFFGNPFSKDWGMKTIQPYFGVNFNVCAINRQSHYGLFASSLSKNGQYKHPVLRSFSVVIGVTFEEIQIGLKSAEPNITGLWKLGNSNLILLTGGAIRLTDYLRFTLGTSWYRYLYSNNPLDTKQWRLGAGLYFGFSLDLDVRNYARSVGQFLFPNYFNPVPKL